MIIPRPILICIYLWTASFARYIHKQMKPDTAVIPYRSQQWDLCKTRDTFLSLLETWGLNRVHICVIIPPQCYISKVKIWEETPGLNLQLILIGMTLQLILIGMTLDACVFPSEGPLFNHTGCPTFPTFPKSTFYTCFLWLCNFSHCVLCLKKCMYIHF